MFAALFVVIFAETGLVIFPLLPGDSLLFIAGTVAAASGVPVHLLVLTLFAAAVLGDSVNYAVGRFIGPKAFHRPQDTRLGRWLKPEYLAKTHSFYEKYGGFTIVIGRFVPIVRTFAPFLAGVGEMTYRKFLSYNVLGGAAWVGSLTYTSRAGPTARDPREKHHEPHRPWHRGGLADADDGAIRERAASATPSATTNDVC